MRGYGRERGGSEGDVEWRGVEVSGERWRCGGCGCVRGGGEG